MARAMGAYCSPPVPSFSAMGIMPMMVASEVIRMGRRRTRQAVITASATRQPCSSSRCAKSTIRMLLESAMPTSISTPISDITFRVVCGERQNHQHADEAHRNRQHDQKRIDEGPELRHQDQVEQDERKDEADREALERFVHALTMPRRFTRMLRGKLRVGDDLSDCAGDLAQILARRRDVDVGDALDLIVIDFGGRLDVSPA